MAVFMATVCAPMRARVRARVRASASMGLGGGLSSERLTVRCLVVLGGGAVVRRCLVVEAASSK